MYNLVVSGWGEAWNGEPFPIEVGRCVNEYTDNEIRARLGDFSAESIAELVKLPTIFAYEHGCEKPPKFGVIREVTFRKNQGMVRIEYDLQEVEPFLSHEKMFQMSFELDIGKQELHRTHWAVKDVNLPKELHRVGIALPGWTQRLRQAVDISTHQFDVALSFPGEARSYVEGVAAGLERLVGPDRYFYDENYVSQLARPSLDLLLQQIYGARSKLVVVFVGGHYQQKDWCGIEWRAIRQIISDRREGGRVMFVRLDPGEVEGVFANDGYIDASRFSSDQVAAMIVERLSVLQDAH